MSIVDLHLGLSFVFRIKSLIHIVLSCFSTTMRGIVQCPVGEFWFLSVSQGNLVLGFGC